MSVKGHMRKEQGRAQGEIIENLRKCVRQVHDDSDNNVTLTYEAIYLIK